MLFGRRRKEQIHAQAVGLMNEWNGIITASGGITFGMSEDELENMDESELMPMLAEYAMALLGVLTYMVAGLNHVDAAQEMIEIFKKIYATYPEEMNPEGITPNEAASRVNTYYQKATAVSETLMGQGKGLPDITRAHAESIFKWLDTGASEDDVAFVENCLNIFYKDTYEKYYG